MKDKVSDRGFEAGGQNQESPDRLPAATCLEPAAHLSRLRWRCRRGMKELDVVLTRYLEGDYPQAPPRERHAFEGLLDLQDPDLLYYLIGRSALPEDPETAHVLKKLAQHRN